MTIKSLKKTDSFAQAPMVALLPVLSQVDSLKSIKSFLYARYEKVAALRTATSGRDEEGRSQTEAELAMLLELLDWLKIKPTEE